MQTTREMREAVLDAAKAADVVVMAAAVADFRPTDARHREDQEGARASRPRSPSRATPTSCANWSPRTSRGRLVVGFAAETGDEHGSVLDYGRAKLERKGCDLLVVNAVGAGRAFEVEDNEGWLLGADGSSEPLPMGSKAALAARVWDAVAARRRLARERPLDAIGHSHGSCDEHNRCVTGLAFCQVSGLAESGGCR